MAQTKESAPPRAGRDLKAAVLVGVGLLGVALVGLLVFDWLVVLLVAALLVVGVTEVGRAVRTTGLDVPLPPLWFSAVVLPVSAWISGVEGLFFALLGCLMFLCLWTEARRVRPTGQTILAGVFAVMWAPFLLSFGVALLDQPRGNYLVACLLLMVVSNDTFGYLVGSRLGKTPIAARISPKKSWEGLAGSLAGSVLVGVLAVPLLTGLPWWAGVILGVTTVAAATSGDFAESMVKRELGVKDMSSVLPGHGGVMDRLDSLVFAAPVAYTVLALPVA
ncbi:phosphatidate cytidylyltransferase [Micrococcus cohnii]|uniref:Phosphatidate cytidylyltransferase n=1 Tax=Micrococcus cohnii TaxID=993416 RepID=A0A7W7GMG9_9MICC|nr:phosphatidate cytidylyltransferase [Micrococcus cohnii]MBB4734814.1 phosphatidate cytidylyltransferase [Micrococcus cohnii]